MGTAFIKRYAATATVQFMGSYAREHVRTHTHTRIHTLLYNLFLKDRAKTC